MMSIKTIIGVIICTLLLSQSANAADIKFQGKVVDADTLEPIEEAVVVAVWDKSRVNLIETDTIFEDAKETLTDKNGDWLIIGPKGHKEAFDKNHHRIISLIFRKYYLLDPDFIIYKPGYWGTAKGRQPGEFQAYSCVDPDQGLEGIVLSIRRNTIEEEKAFSRRYRGGFLPFVPLKDPEKKLRALDFSFEYPDNLGKADSKAIHLKGIRPYWVYTVNGLKKAKTKEERLKALRFSAGEKALPILDKMQSEERERLLGPIRRKTK